MNISNTTWHWRFMSTYNWRYVAHVRRNSGRTDSCSYLTALLGAFVSAIYHVGSVCVKAVAATLAVVMLVGMFVVTPIVAVGHAVGWWHIPKENGDFVALGIGVLTLEMLILGLTAFGYVKDEWRAYRRNHSNNTDEPTAGLTTMIRAKLSKFCVPITVEE